MHARTVGGSRVASTVHASLMAAFARKNGEDDMDTCWRAVTVLDGMGEEVSKRFPVAAHVREEIQGIA